MDAQSWLRYEGSQGVEPWINLGDCPVQLDLKPYAVALIDLPS
jgi:hypothetical protein